MTFMFLWLEKCAMKKMYLVCFVWSYVMLLNYLYAYFACMKIFDEYRATNVIQINIGLLDFFLNRVFYVFCYIFVY